MSKSITLTDKEIDTILHHVIVIGDNIQGDSRYWKSLQKKLETPHKRIAIQSAKAKGRELQKWVVNKIAALLHYELPENKDDRLIRSREMGQAGTDVVIAPELRKQFPFAVECKNQEQISLPAFIAQARSNISESLPYMMLVIRNKAIKEPLICMEWGALEYLFREKGILNERQN